jgi:hypothetical protein
MAQPSIQELLALLQAHLNFLELCRALSQHTDDPHVREALGVLIEETQDSTTSLAGHLRRLGAAPGAYELDRQGKASIRDVLEERSLHKQLLAIRRGLADLVAWYSPHLVAPTTYDWLAPLSAQAEHMLVGWDQHLREMKAANF